MDPKRLEHFLRIARAGSVSRAAEDLEVAQPTLSRELREMEQELGVPLLTRHARGVSLTPAGEALRTRAEVILSLLGGLRDDIRSAGDEPTGRVALGMPSSLCGCLATRIVSEFRTRYPQVRLELREAPSNQLRLAVLNRELDVAVLTAPVSDRQLVLRPLLTEPFVLVAPAGQTHARRQIRLEEALALPLIVPIKPNATRTLIDTAIERSGKVPDILLETDSTQVSEFLAAGLGYALLPASSAASTAMRHLDSVPIRDMAVIRLLALPGGAAISLASQRMVSLLCELTRELVESGQLQGAYTGP